MPEPIDESRPGCEIGMDDRIDNAAGREDRHPVGEDEQRDLCEPEVGRAVERQRGHSQRPVGQRPSSRDLNEGDQDAEAKAQDQTRAGQH